ncbi:MAG TPA: TrbG/VirB9 family P-type conjugative transfer protein [Candidatus Acidoferrales bacterium]|nr:TrbG/VirB9 family P-type conjugative transfer protein [Candidatus Acidoferrales bacterium]
MKALRTCLRRSVAGLLSLFLFGPALLAQTPIRTPAETARVVKYGQDDIVTVHAKLRYSTLIVLPESEEILDFTTGDKDFWIINGAHNLCYIHPAQAGIRSNLNLITASGQVYSFLLEEISNEPNVEPDLKIFIEPKEQSGIGMNGFARNFVPDGTRSSSERPNPSRRKREPI